MTRTLIDETPEDGHGTIYAIVHEPSGRRYVGSTTKRLSVRMAGHRRSLNKGDHGSGALQADWITDGAAAFYVEVLQRAVPYQVLQNTEQQWMDQLESPERDGIYNKRSISARAQFGQTSFIKAAAEKTHLEAEQVAAGER